MKLKRTFLSGTSPVFGHDSSMQMAQGGFNLDTSDLAAGAKVPAGSVLSYDEGNRKAKVLKAAIVVEAVADGGKAIKVAKGQLFQPNEFVMANGKSTKINSINTSNTAYDVLNVANEIDALAEGAALVAGFEEAAADAKTKYDLAPGTGGLLYNEAIVPTDDDYVFVDVVVSHKRVYARRIPAVADVVKAKLPNIIFSQSR